MLLVSKELSPGSLLTDLASPSTELTCTQISVLIVFEETCLIKEFPQVENHMWLYASFSKSLFIVKEWSCCVRREGRVPGKKRALLYGISTQSQPAWDSLGLDFLVMNSVTLPIRKVKSCYSFLSHRAMLRIEWICLCEGLKDFLCCANTGSGLRIPLILFVACCLDLDSLKNNWRLISVTHKPRSNEAVLSQCCIWGAVVATVERMESSILVLIGLYLGITFL